MERTLVLQELEGPESLGVYYSLTDRAPKPAEYGHLTQGVFHAGNFLFTFTILHRTKDAPERATALDMLKTARLTGRAAD